MDRNNNHLINSLQKPWLYRLFLLTKLPAALFAGLRIKELTEEQCTVSVPYRWSTRNPFGSTYFACMAMAAEMSTGALVLSNLRGNDKNISWLVTGVRGSFHKKAKGLTWFTCKEGPQLKEVIDQAMLTGEAQSFIAHSRGLNDDGQVMADFEIIWSFKKKPTQL